MNVDVLYGIIFGSSQRALERVKYTGKIDLRAIAAMNTINKYLIKFDEFLTIEQKLKLEALLICVQNKNPGTVCNYRKAYPSGVQAPDMGEINTAPVVADITVDYDADYYIIPYSQIVSTFIDVDGDSPETLRVVSVPTDGTFRYQNVSVVAGQEINLSSFGELRYTRTNNAISTDSFVFRISDNNINKLFSNMATFTININQAVNQCPDAVGTNSFTIDSAGTQIFTLADFTTGTTPPYSDPEGDPAESIRVTSIPVTGSLKLSGVTVTANQVIPVANISAGLLSYVADPLNTTGYAESFDFDISDTGASCFTSGGQVTMTINSYVNQPPTIGDGNRTVGEGIVITFTRADFTSNTTPPYYDPEGDIADKLKVTSLPVTGDIKLNNINIVVNDVINFSDIDAGNLTYVQDAGQGGTAPTFSFEIADAGSGTFVS